VIILCQAARLIDYTVPALLLIIIVGGSMLLAAALIRTERTIGVLASLFAGLVMMIFEIVEIAILDRTGASGLVIALVLQVFYFTLGLTIFVLSSFLWVTEYQSRHFQNKPVSHA
jgi:hypothetical protein